MRPLDAYLALGRVPLRHHVYTSLGGYGDLGGLAASDPETAAALELVAAPLAAAASAEPVRSFFPLGPYYAVSSSVAAGRDHVGRPRGLCHTVLLPLHVVRALPWFVPQAVPDEVFVDPDDRSGLTLPEAVHVGALNEPPSLAPLVEACRAPSAPLLLACLLAGGRCVLEGAPGRSLRLLGHLLHVLPPERRVLVAGLAAPAALEGARGTACAVPSAPDGAPRSPDELGVRLDAENGEVRLPLELAELALREVLEHADATVVARHDNFLARWCGGPTETAGRELAEAFAILVPWVEPDGSLGSLAELPAAKLHAALAAAERCRGAARLAEELTRWSRALPPAAGVTS